MPPETQSPPADVDGLTLEQTLATAIALDAKVTAAQATYDEKFKEAEQSLNEAKQAQDQASEAAIAGWNKVATKLAKVTEASPVKGGQLGSLLARVSQATAAAASVLLILLSFAGCDHRAPVSDELVATNVLLQRVESEVSDLADQVTRLEASLDAQFKAQVPPFVIECPCQPPAMGFPACPPPPAPPRDFPAPFEEEQAKAEPPAPPKPVESKLVPRSPCQRGPCPSGAPHVTRYAPDGEAMLEEQMLAQADPPPFFEQPLRRIVWGVDRRIGAALQGAANVIAPPIRPPQTFPPLPAHVAGRRQRSLLRELRALARHNARYGQAIRGGAGIRESGSVEEVEIPARRNRDARRVVSRRSVAGVARAGG